MPPSVENESEILLGNKQLLAVFAVVAVLLAVAFTGGYMLGKSSAEKKAVSSGADTQTTAAGNDGSSALVPRTVTPEDQLAAKPDAQAAPVGGDTSPPSTETKAGTTLSRQTPSRAADGGVEPLGRHVEGMPRPGQTFVQVAAVTRAQAEGTAEVLRKQHFPARIAPKPGSKTIFRVLVGPTKDAGEITATRDALRKIGFRDVVVQRY